MREKIKNHFNRIVFSKMYEKNLLYLYSNKVRIYKQCVKIIFEDASQM